MPHLHFEDMGDHDIVLNKKDEPLGQIHYFRKWKCHIFDPSINIRLSASCLREIAKYLEQKGGGA